MKKKFRQVVSMTAAAVMAAGLMLSGCGSKEAVESDPGDVAATNETPDNETAPASDEEAAVTVAEESGGGADSLKIWSVTTKPWVGYADASESPFHTGLSEKTGITWNWEWPMEGADWETAYNLMLMEDPLPDVIYYWKNHRTASTNLADGLIIALNDYMEYAPNLQKLFDENEDIRKDCMTDDGQIYMFPMVNETYALTTSGPMVRKDWLDEQSLPVPVTYDDWETTLKAFKEAYGATFATIDDLYWFGFLGGTREYIVDDDGKVQWGYTLDSTRKSLEILARWQQEGLLDPDFASLDSTLVNQKITNGETGLCFGYGISEEMLKDGDWIGITFPVEKEGDIPEFTRMTTRVDYGFGAVVTTSCKDIPAVMKALDWAYGEEGSLYWNCGEEGRDYTINDAGDITFTDKIMNNPEISVGEAMLQVSASQPGGPMVRIEKAMKAKSNDRTNEAREQWCVSNMQNHMMPLITQTKEETEAISSKTTALSSYAEEMWFSFISGETPINDETWDAYKKQLDDLGLQEVLVAKQAALDRYNARS